MEVIRFIVFLIGVVLVSGQCDESKIQQCWDQIKEAFSTANGIQDIALKICGESRKTAFICIKTELNKCSSSLSSTLKDKPFLAYRVTIEGFEKVCDELAKTEEGSFACFIKAVQNSQSSNQTCRQSDPATANLNTEAIRCRTIDTTFKCVLDSARNDCPRHVATFRSLHDTVQTLFACKGSGNSSNRYNSAPTFLLIALGVQVLVSVGL